jgi:gliding motility-associated-like protein
VKKKHYFVNLKTEIIMRKLISFFCLCLYLHGGSAQVGSIIEAVDTIQVGDTIHVYGSTISMPNIVHFATDDFDPFYWYLVFHCQVDTLHMHGNNENVPDAVGMEGWDVSMQNWIIELIHIWIGGYGQQYDPVNNPQANGLTPNAAISGPVHLYGQGAAPPEIVPVGNTATGEYFIHVDVSEYSFMRITAYNNPNSTTVWNTGVTPAGVVCTVTDIVDPGACEQATVCFSTQVNPTGVNPCTEGAGARLIYELNGISDTLYGEDLGGQDTVCVVTYCSDDTFELIEFTHWPEGNGPDCVSSSGIVFTTIKDIAITDTTYLQFTTCVSDSAGIFTQTYALSCECDSAVVSEYIYVPATVEMLGPTFICPGDVADLSAQTGIGYSYLWSTGVSLEQIEVSVPRDYSVTVTNSAGCTAVDSISVMFYEPTDMFIDGVLGVCQHDELSLKENSGDISDIVWIFENETLGTGGEFMIAEIQLSDAGEYLVIGYDMHGCEVSTTVIVEVFELPEVSVHDQHVCVGNELTIVIEDPSDSQSYLFSGPISFVGIDTHVVASIEHAGNYRVITTDEHYCRNEAHFRVEVAMNAVYLANVFTPNDDGVNDYLMVQSGNEIQKIIQFRIFDRWGEEVFAKENFSPNPNDFACAWDGRFRGKEMPVGVYTFFVESVCPSGGGYFHAGSVTLVR